MPSEKKNKELVNQIIAAAISLSLGILLLGLSYVTVASDFLIILFIPFLGALTALRTNYKGQILFIVGAVLVSFIDMQEGFFSFLPNLIIGVLYGDFVKKFSLSFYSFLGAVTISTAIQIGLIYPINFFYNVDLVLIFSKIFGLNEDIFYSFLPAFYFLLSLVQVTITFIILDGELKKLVKVKPVEDKYDFIVILIMGLAFIGIFIVSYFFVKWLAYLSFCYFLVVSSFIFIKSFDVSTKPLIIFYSAIGITSLVVFSFLFSVLKIEDYYMALFPFGVCFYLAGVGMVEYKRKSKRKIVAKEELKDLLK